MGSKLEAIAENLGLEPMRALSLVGVNGVSEMLKRMAGTAFTGRTLGEAADVMEGMIRDSSCKVVLTLSGAMTMAGLGQLIREMVDRGWIQCLVATGALVGHGLVENLGMVHYKADPAVSDEEYLARHLNRVYDTIEPEQNLDDLETIVRGVLDRLADERQGAPVGTVDLLGYLGQHLPGAGILQAAHQRKVPVIIPAFTDSELGLDFAVHGVRRAREQKPRLVYDAFRDLEFFRELGEATITSGGRLGIFTVGGGVPRNWAQQIGPYVDVRNKRLGLDVQPIRFHYGVRICPDPVHYGHLSGCTYSEGVSWGKFMPKREGGRYAEVLTDATIAWPLLVQALIERGL